ncbi:hypothetical protein VPH35_036505 [Triticum aestivum]|uniref:Uncharacterized protein n=1 Tax=Aegilops tauschii TaxID=37682 RepID=M8BRE1_AEGTA
MPHAAVILLLAVFTPLHALAATNHSLPGGHSCGTQGRYAPNSTSKANLRLIPATLATELVNASCPARAHALVDQVAVSAYCHCLPDVVNSSGTCIACVALAFQDARRLCRYHRDAMLERGQRPTNGAGYGRNGGR